MAILHRLVEHGRRRAAQHALRRRRTPRRRLREPPGDQPGSHLLPHPRASSKGPRASLPGNDQTGAALAGPDWLDGGLDHDGIPFWPVISLGDTGNGFLSAIAIVQALYHRDRTGEGQFVDTSIIYAQLLNASMAWIDGRRRRATVPARELDADAARLERAVPPLRDRRRLAVRRRGDAASTGGRLAEALGHGEWTSDTRFVDTTGRGPARC